MLQANGIYKSFDRAHAHRVLRGVSLSIDMPGLVLIVGANGAGKSTLLRICAGLLRPDSGSVMYGEGIRKSGINFCGHQAGLYEHLTVQENLRFFMSLQNLPFTATVLPQWGLDTLAKRLVSDLSQGERQRVSLAVTLLGDRALLLLDEPTAGLDSRWSEVLLQILRERCKRSICLLVTHDIPRFAPLAARTLILKHGQIAADHRDQTAAETERLYFESQQ